MLRLKNRFSNDFHWKKKYNKLIWHKTICNWSYVIFLMDSKHAWRNIVFSHKNERFFMTCFRLKRCQPIWMAMMWIIEDICCALQSVEHAIFEKIYTISIQVKFSKSSQSGMKINRPFTNTVIKLSVGWNY